MEIQKIENKIDETEDTAPVSSSETKTDEQDIDFDKELQNLETGGEPKPATPPGKSTEDEKKQAEFTLASIAKRVKDLGGDPASIIGATPAPVTQPVMDTSRFVTKDDLAQQEANKLARSAGESKVIMWYVRNRGLTVEEAHLLANKGRLTSAIKEVNRARSIEPSRGGGGPGAAPRSDAEDPVMPDAVTLARLKQSGMTYDPAQKAFVGTKSALSWVKGKGWVSGRVVPDKK